MARRLLSSPFVRRVLLATCLAAALAGCGASTSSTTASPSASATSPPAPGSAPAAGCRRVATPGPRAETHLSAPRTPLDPAKTYTVSVVTNCGSFAIRLAVRQSPRTSASFAALVRRGFFDGLTFHRVAAGFVIQGGDPTGTGAGGPGYTVVEPPPAGYHYRVGDVAMAKTQSDPPGASGSQFFVLTGAASSLPPDYALLGHVVAGMATVQRIAALASAQGDGAPTQPVVMSQVTLSLS